MGKWQLLPQLPPQSSNGSVLHSGLQAICPVWTNLCSSKPLAYGEESSLSTVGISTELTLGTLTPEMAASLCVPCGNLTDISVGVNDPPGGICSGSASARWPCSGTCFQFLAWGSRACGKVESFLRLFHSSDAPQGEKPSLS